MTRRRARDGSEAEVPLDAGKLSFVLLGPRERVAEIGRLAWWVAGERSLILAVFPAPIVMQCQQAIFVPRRSGLTVAAPLTSWSLTPSLG
jgi:hypothetical protein